MAAYPPPNWADDDGPIDLCAMVACGAISALAAARISFHGRNELWCGRPHMGQRGSSAPKIKRGEYPSGCGGGYCGCFAGCGCGCALGHCRRSRLIKRHALSRCFRRHVLRYLYQSRHQQLVPLLAAYLHPQLCRPACSYTELNRQQAPGPKPQSHQLFVRTSLVLSVVESDSIWQLDRRMN